MVEFNINIKQKIWKFLEGEFLVCTQLTKCVMRTLLYFLELAIKTIRIDPKKNNHLAIGLSVKWQATSKVLLSVCLASIKDGIGTDASRVFLFPMFHVTATKNNFHVMISIYWQDQERNETSKNYCQIKKYNILPLTNVMLHAVNGLSVKLCKVRQKER